MALLASNSSNLKMWNFYRVITPPGQIDQLVKPYRSQ